MEGGKGISRREERRQKFGRATTGGEWWELDHVQPAAAQNRGNSCLYPVIAMVRQCNVKESMEQVKMPGLVVLTA